MVSTMKLSAGSQCVKYLMFVFNLLFVITGIILISVGSVIAGVYSKYFLFLDDKFLSVPNLLIATGAIIFFIAFFGCCGAVRESYCMIITFTSLLVLIFIFELAAGISGYVLRDSANDIIQTKMHENIKHFNSSGPDSTTQVWTELQSTFQCCGINSSSDWQDVFHSDELPKSCCEPNEVVTTCTTKTPPYREGCLIKFENFISSHAIELGGVGIGIAFIQAMGILFSVHLARAIKRNYETV